MGKTFDRSQREQARKTRRQAANFAQVCEQARYGLRLEVKKDEADKATRLAQRQGLRRVS